MKKDRILLIEDNDADALYVIDGLERRASQFSCTRVQKLEDAIEQLAKVDFDVALLDLSLPDGFGLPNFERLMRANPKLPVVILTGMEDEELALNAVRAGAQDYLCKKDLNHQLLFRSIRYAIERKQIYEFLRITLSQLQEAMTSLNLSAKATKTGLWFLDLESDRVTWNEQMTVLFGMTEKDAPRHLREVFSLIHPDDVDQVEKIVNNALDLHEEWQTCFRAIWSDGSVHHLECQGKTFFDDRGKANRMAGTCRDVSTERQEEVAIKRLAVLEQREDFTATLTHDLKNPLIGTNQILELLLNKRLGEINTQQADLLARIKDSNSHLLLLIQNLTEVYRYEHQVTSHVREELDVVPVIASCVNEITIQASHRNVSIETHFAEPRWKMCVDQLAFRRVIQNLLDNAVKFSRENGSVSVRVYGEKDRSFIEVSDNGLGMSQEEHLNLFKRFGQGHQGQKAGTGSGLGLYLCKQIVDAHNGEIMCSSEENVGSTFTVVLPRMTDVPVPHFTREECNQ